jgi:hypothetical protein
MGYDYTKERHNVFTDQGQRMFLKIRDESTRLIAQGGACTSGALMRAVQSGDTWTMLACIDRLVELGELREITGESVMGQHRVFIGGSPR